MSEVSQSKRDNALEFLDELDVKHDRLLDELDVLNNRIDAILADYSKSRQTAAAGQPAPTPTSAAAEAASVPANS